VSEFEVLAEGLVWPEGPVWMEDGSVMFVETGAGRILRVASDNRVDVVATPGGGPNGLAVGPGGFLYVCNNGGMICHTVDGLTLTGGDAPADYDTGRIERVNLQTGAVERLYEAVDGRKLAGPNDIVFDQHGGFWFSDTGKPHANHSDHGGIFYAAADGSKITRVVDRIGANGIGLSPDGATLYVATTFDRLVLAFDVIAPGELAPPQLLPGRVVASFPNRQYVDSLAVAADGSVCVATCIENPGIATVDPESGQVQIRPFPDFSPTNICFGGSDFQDAWITFSGSGKLIKTRWDRPGLRLVYYA